LKFLVFEDEHKKRSRKHGTFEQTCRFLHEECGFPLHPNTAREKANAEQQRRLLRQAGVGVEVEKMSDTAALELRRVDALKAEPEVILDAKRKVVENAGSLTKEAIASSIQTVSKDEDWENQYKFRYDKPKKRSQSEKPEPISRKELEDTQNRNTLLRRENEALREQLQSTQEELEQVKTTLEEKVGNEVFLSGLVAEAQSQLDEKDKEIQALMWELEEMRRRSA
jgi:isopropylmalate/homocitrate/citramalate synthase